MFVFCNNTYADFQLSPKGILVNRGQKNFGGDRNANEGIKKAQDTSAKLISQIIALIQVVGTGLAVIIMLIFGIKYMVGSIEEKVEIKRHAFAYVLGASVFFGATLILEIIQQFIEKNWE